MDASAPDDAIRWYSLALEHLEGEDEEVSTEVAVLTRLARAQQQTAMGQVRDTVIRAAALAQPAGLAREMAEVLLVSGRMSFDGGQLSDPEKMELLELALDRLDGEPALQARVKAALAVEMIFVGDTRRFALLDDAIETARSSADPRALVEAAHARFNARSRATWSGDVFRAEQALGAEMSTATETLGDPFLRSLALMGRGFGGIASGDRPDTRDALERLQDLASKTNSPAIRRATLMVAQMDAALEGHLAVAEALSAELYAVLHSMGLPEAVTYRAVMGFAGRREQDRLLELLPVWLAAPDATSPIPNATSAAVMFMVAITGDPDEAAQLLDAAATNRFEDVPDDAGWPVAIAMYAEVAARVSDRVAAAALVEILVPFAEVGVNMCTGGIVHGPANRLVALLEAVLGHDEAADRYFVAAIEDSGRLESPIWNARCRVDWAERLLARGEVNRATVLIDEAEAALGDLDLPALRRQLSGLRA